MPTTRDNGHGLHFLLMGALVGMLGGILMMLFVMLATATYLQMGFFTPLYAIAAPLTGPQALITSLLRGSFYLAFGPALLGLVFHLLGSFSFTIANALFYGLPLGLWPVVQPELFTALPTQQAV